MNSQIQSIILAIASTLLLGIAGGRPVDISAPIGEVGRANMRGDLELWREIHTVGLDFGNNLFLPLRYEFSTEIKNDGVFGSGFYVPLFESNNVLLRELMMKVNLPCGKSLYMRRDQNDPSKFQTLDQQWIGYRDEKRSSFMIWRNDGWKILYRRGHIISLETDENHVFDWVYNGGLLLGINEDNSPVITIATNATGKIIAFSYEGKEFKTSYAPRPMLQVDSGRNLIKELSNALTSFKYPDGSEETFEFSLTENMQPNVEFKDALDNRELYSWDPESGHIVSEAGEQGSWTYKVGETTEPFDLPTVERINAHGQSEKVEIDSKLGTTLEKDIDGQVTVRSVSEAPGPLYGKLRRVSTTLPDGTAINLQFGYDELGRMIRKVDANGFITQFKFVAGEDHPSVVVFPPSEPALLLELNKTEINLQNQVNRTTISQKKDEEIQKLAMFYIYKMGKTQNALALIPTLSNPEKAFDIRLHSIVGDYNLSQGERLARLQALKQMFPLDVPLIESVIKSILIKV